MDASKEANDSGRIATLPILIKELIDVVMKILIMQQVISNTHFSRWIGGE
ncbi:MAG TPA: hypothetical protein VK751_02575 [Undibacterium sp.]|nr:hypothetical protein [Undibacterium sp.]